MSAAYRDFSELVVHEVRDKDYRFHIVDRGTEVTVIAIHGGGIEPLTSELASAIAGEEHNLYDFQGIRPSGNEVLRVPVAAFQEMRLQAMLKRSRLGISVQGSMGESTTIGLGGRNRRFRQMLQESLEEAGFAVGKPVLTHAAHDPRLFFNAPAEGGVLLEFSQGLRQRMTERCSEGNAGAGNALFDGCVTAIRSAVERYQREMASDLDVTMQRFEKTTQELQALLRALERDEQN